MSEEKKIESGTSIFDCGDAMAVVMDHEDGNLAVDFWRNQSYCNGDEIPAIGILFDVRMAQKTVDILSRFIDIELGESRWSEMVGSRVVLKVTNKDGDMGYDYYDAVVVVHLVVDGGNRLVLLKFGDGTCIWTRVARHQQDEWLETSNRWLRVVNVDSSGDPYE